VLTGKTQYLVAVATLGGEVEGHGCPGHRACQRPRWGESESGRKGTTDVHSGVEIGDRAKKHWTGRPLVDELAVFDLGVENVKVKELACDSSLRELRHAM
jgi:hypothetical protein